jgi:hypothetical protein
MACKMCYQVKCKQCEKITWRGCGKHVEQTMKDVPDDQKCKCKHEDDKNKNIFPAVTHIPI